MLSEPYQPRSIRFLELWQDQGWSMKVYYITYQRPVPRTDLIHVSGKILGNRDCEAFLKSRLNEDAYH